MGYQAIDELLGVPSRELWLVTSRSESALGGLIASFVAQVSLVPELPRVLIGIAKHHHTWSLIEESEAFALHLLAIADVDLAWRFGLATGHQVDKFHGLHYRTGKTGSPIVECTMGWLDCVVETRVDIGDRTIYVAAVVDGAKVGGSDPLTAQQLFGLASDEQRQELDSALVRDRAIDSEAIERWRLGDG
ncbi:MAG: flavin reductase family protein [Planctomycetota bacterium]